MLRINYQSPEWLALKEMIEAERALALKMLVKDGLTEVEYGQWRGRAALANKLIDQEEHYKFVTDKGE